VDLSAERELQGVADSTQKISSQGAGRGHVVLAITLVPSGSIFLTQALDVFMLENVF